MKILHINMLFTPRRFGGAEVFLERFAADLVGRGHQVQVACLSPEPEQHGNEQLQVHEFKLRNVYWPFDGAEHPRWKKAVWHLRNSFGRGSAADIDALLASEKPDLVHTHNLFGFTSAVWPRIAARGIPLVHTIHDYALLCPSTTMFRREENCQSQCLGCRVLSSPQPAHSEAVTAVVGCSDFVLQRHVRNGYFARASQHVIHSGDPHDHGQVAPARTPETAVLRVGYLGRLAPSKGLELMLDSLAPLIPDQCEVRVAGTGPTDYEDSLKSRYAPQGVHFVGRVQPGEFLADLDLLVVPSQWQEPFGLVVREAMNAGVPVVASAVGGIPEIVQHGRNGFLFEPTDGTALRSHVSRLACDRDLHRQLTSTCRAEADTCKFDRTVDSYLNVYAQTLN